MPMLKVTLLYAAILGIINLWLSWRAGKVRVSDKIMIGDGGNELLRARMRAHANFNEYVPLALILMALIEFHAGPALGLWVLGGLLALARLAHPFGMERPAPNALRAGGILVTYLVTIALILWAIYVVFQPSGAPIDPRFA
ncbi:MAPEG family protein [Sphingomonas sp. LaA6.9]|uniref:MAPEG family protein n=1 Tax=Sphingomonas sp. LaA6.9 TaxID=2919914 RepID=UPI001F4F590A|nr:MAPEG family protein [Sphingomonas sp. LaA6.9]MCJ8158619.1 MAPEG family protein [Sphingomonas sp. LaA6.9]